MSSAADAVEVRIAARWKPDADLIRRENEQDLNRPNTFQEAESLSPGEYSFLIGATVQETIMQGP